MNKNSRTVLEIQDSSLTQLKKPFYLMMVTLLVVVGLVGGDEDGLVGGVALELLAAETLRVGRVQVEPRRSGGEVEKRNNR